MLKHSKIQRAHFWCLEDSGPRNTSWWSRAWLQAHIWTKFSQWSQITDCIRIRNAGPRKRSFWFKMSGGEREGTSLRVTVMLLILGWLENSHGRLKHNYKTPPLLFPTAVRPAIMLLGHSENRIYNVILKKTVKSMPRSLQKLLENAHYEKKNAGIPMF